MTFDEYGASDSYEMPGHSFQQPRENYLDSVGPQDGHEFDILLVGQQVSATNVPEDTAPSWTQCQDLNREQYRLVLTPSRCYNRKFCDAPISPPNKQKENVRQKKRERKIR